MSCKSNLCAAIAMNRAIDALLADIDIARVTKGKVLHALRERRFSALQVNRPRAEH